ncbi:hypothetical protein Hdeb2414_s0009g00308641 [Helianthus debilis subsp. tardiflorus]
MLWQERGNNPLKTPRLSRRSLLPFSEHHLFFSFQIPNFIGLPLLSVVLCFTNAYLGLGVQSYWAY